MRDDKALTVRSAWNPFPRVRRLAPHVRVAVSGAMPCRIMVTVQSSPCNRRSGHPRSATQNVDLDSLPDGPYRRT